MDIRRYIGRNIRRIRLEKGISQEALALEAEVDRAYMSGLERGVKNPTVLLLDRIAQVLKISVSELTRVNTGSARSKNLPRGRHVAPTRKRTS